MVMVGGPQCQNLCLISWAAQFLREEFFHLLSGERTLDVNVLEVEWEKG